MRRLKGVPRIEGGLKIALFAWLALLAAPDDCAAQPVSDARWLATGSMTTERTGHTATLLQNGTVLVAGGRSRVGPVGSAELYDPATGTWTPTGSLNEPRVGHTATLLDDGRVLVVGGDAGPLNPAGIPVAGTAELYDPATGTWSRTGSLLTARCCFTATRLASGKVLVAGGLSNSDVALASTELFDPVGGTWQPTGSLLGARFSHGASLLQDGRVLVVGGSNDDFFGDAIATTELYDPATGAWSGAGYAYPAQYPSMTPLPTGSVLAAGGDDTPLSVATSYRFDPITGWNATGNMTVARQSHTATLLPSGRVLVAGGFGFDRNRVDLDSAESYDPSTERWSSAGRMSTTRSGHTATLLANGAVLVAGGIPFSGNPKASLASAELYVSEAALPGTINSGFTGSWYDPAQSGHGIVVQVLPGNRFYAAWFTFDPSGSQAWFAGLGTYSGNTASITAVEQPTGGRWIPNFDPNQIVRNPWGTLTFTFTDCNHGRVDFSSTAGFGAGSMNLTRLTQPAGLACR